VTEANSFFLVHFTWIAIFFFRNDRDVSRTSRSSSRHRSGRSTSKSRTRRSRSKSPNAKRQSRRSRSRTRRSRSGHRRSLSRSRRSSSKDRQRSRSGSKRRRSRRSRSRDLGIEMPQTLTRRTVAYATSLAAELSRRRREIAGKPDRTPNSSEVRRSTAPSGVQSNLSNDPIVIDSDESDDGSKDSDDENSSTSDEGNQTSNGAVAALPAPVIDSDILSAIPMPEPKAKTGHQVELSPGAIPLPHHLSDSLPSLCPSEIPMPDQVTSLPRVTAVAAQEPIASSHGTASVQLQAHSLTLQPAAVVTTTVLSSCSSVGQTIDSSSHYSVIGTVLPEEAKMQKAGTVPHSAAQPVPRPSRTSPFLQPKDGADKVTDGAANGQFCSVNVGSDSKTSPSFVNSSPQTPVEARPANAWAQVADLHAPFFAKRPSTSPATPEKKPFVNARPVLRLTELPMPPGVYEEDSESASEDIRYVYWVCLEVGKPVEIRKAVLLL
jgi:hypothetical protein